MAQVEEEETQVELKDKLSFWVLGNEVESRSEGESVGDTDLNSYMNNYLYMS
jgi:hypothetical protein